jgi:hypothetical protein
MWLVIEGDPGAVEHLTDRLVKRRYLDAEFNYTLYDEDPLVQARETVAELETRHARAIRLLQRWCAVDLRGVRYARRVLDTLRGA